MSEDQQKGDLESICTELEKEKHFKGRYTLEEAAKTLGQSSGERAEDMLKKLKKAVSDGELAVYEPGKEARYKPEIVRDFYEEVYWDDLNRWLNKFEPRIAWRFPMSDSVRNESEFIAAFGETVYNGTLIDWYYWVHQMATLTAAQAARLMCGLDPDIFDNLDNRPNDNDPSQACDRARKIQRLAENHNIEKATPKEWLQWADKRKLKVHVGYRLEVDAIDEALPPGTTQPADKHLPKRPPLHQHHQEQEILRVIHDLGYDPIALPMNVPGKPGVKAAVRKKLSFSTTVFDKAWDRLRAAGEIKNAN